MRVRLLYAIRMSSESASDSEATLLPFALNYTQTQERHTHTHMVECMERRK